MGIPYFVSLDLYTFVISLLLIPEIYYPLLLSEKLRVTLFDSLWFSDDYLTVWKRVGSAIANKKENSYNTILDILTGIKLKCAATNLLLDTLKTI